MSETETEVSPEIVAMTRINATRIQAEILQRLAEVTGVHAAACIGKDASAISRWKASVEDASNLIASLGMDVVPADSLVVPPGDLDAYKRLAYKCLKLELEGKQK